jgi:hypothetical protein
MTAIGPAYPTLTTQALDGSDEQMQAAHVWQRVGHPAGQTMHGAHCERCTRCGHIGV